jgi:hypothetical protein
VPEHRIQQSLSRKCTLGALNFCRLVDRAEPLTPSSSSETARVEAPMAAQKEGIVPEAQAQEKRVEPPVPLGAIGDIMSLCADIGRANEVRP